MNLIAKYESLKKRATALIQEGFVNEYLKILSELHRLEQQIESGLMWN